MPVILQPLAPIDFVIEGPSNGQADMPLWQMHIDDTLVPEGGRATCCICHKTFKESEVKYGGYSKLYPPDHYCRKHAGGPGWFEV